MKYFCIGLLILCLLLCACYLSTRALRQEAAAMLRPLRQAAQAFRRGDTAAVSRYVRQTAAQWRRCEPVFASLLSHECTFAVSDDLQALGFCDAASFPQTCEHLMKTLRQIVDMELPNLKNIL